jgi:hypothetical protein
MELAGRKDTRRECRAPVTDALSGCQALGTDLATCTPERSLRLVSDIPITPIMATKTCIQLAVLTILAVN